MEVIETLFRLIQERKENEVEGSYTNYLLTQGIDKICKKVGEEAVEVVIAAKNESQTELISESSDLIYHLLVLLANQGVDITQVFTELHERTEKIGNLKIQNTRGEL